MYLNGTKKKILNKLLYPKDTWSNSLKMIGDICPVYWASLCAYCHDNPLFGKLFYAVVGIKK
jgi:hypothetical protein